MSAEQGVERPGHAAEDSYAGHLAVVTGAASGMGRELVVQLAARGCHVAACDLDGSGLEETQRWARRSAAPGVEITTHVCDVADRRSVEQLADAVATAHTTDHVDYLFNNAGIHGDESFIQGDRDRWERIFSVCWNAVYLPSRAFLPMLMASPGSWLVNTSSLNGFFAKHGDGAPCTAYSAAKFAVRGLSEALIEELRTVAANVRVATVLPGTVATGLGTNSTRILGEPAPSKAAAPGLRTHLNDLGVPASDLDEIDLDRVSDLLIEVFMLPAADAVGQILDALPEGRWRILVGEDAADVDVQVRAEPDLAYDVGGVNQVNRDLLRALVSLTTRADLDRVNGMVDAFRLLIGRYDLNCRVSGDGVQIARHKEEEAEVSCTVTGEPKAFRDVTSRDDSLSEAVAEGRLVLDGDREAFERLVAALRAEPSPGELCVR